MAKRVYLENNYLIIEEATDSTDDKYNLTSNVYIEKNGTLFVFYRLSDNHLIESIYFADILDGEGNAYSSVEFFTALMTNKTGKPDSLDVNLQDQTTPALITKFNQSQTDTTLTVAAVQFEYDITVASTVGMIPGTALIDGSYIILFDVASGRYMTTHIVDINGLVVTLDTQIDFEFPIGTIVDVTSTNLNVDGSITPQVFGIRGLGVIPGIDEKFDITRIIFKCYTDGQVDLNKFGDLPKLIRGVALRFRDGEVRNIFNIKNNGDIESLTLDWKPFTATNPAQGQNGFSARLTFGGQDKIGVVQRLGPGEDLQLIIQDDLTDLVLFEIVAEGHQVDP